MKRVLLACLVTLTTLSAIPGPLAVAQTPAATPDPFMFPINHLVLRMTEGNGYAYARTPSGSLVYGNAYIVNDGLVDEDILPTTRAWYQAHDIQDLYLAHVRLFPEGAGSADSGITIQVYLATLPDSGAAAQLVPATPELMRLQEFDGPDFAQDTATIDDVPDHDQAIIGVTGTDAYDDVMTGDPAGFRAPFTRFVAQAGTTVASVKVTSLDPAFNDALARQLLAEQLDCLAADEPCLPIPLPSGMELVPATPAPSPGARLASAVRLTARCRA